MKRSMISSLALTAAMLVSTGAWAQTMIGQQTVSAEDLPKVQAQCNTLAGVEMQSDASQSDESGAEPTGAGDMASDSEVPNGTDQATSAVDLSLITIEDCKAAGLVK
jgi:hypothetical protein